MCCIKCLKMFWCILLKELQLKKIKKSQMIHYKCSSWWIIKNHLSWELGVFYPCDQWSTSNGTSMHPLLWCNPPMGPFRRKKMFHWFIIKTLTIGLFYTTMCNKHLIFFESIIYFLTRNEMSTALTNTRIASFHNKCSMLLPLFL